MRAKPGCMTVRASVMAVRAALLAMMAVPAAYAADATPVDPAVAALTQRTNEVEAGVGYVTNSSAKFGQYNGLFDKGAYGIFNFDLSNNAPYDSDSSFRSRLLGTDLGLDTRSLLGEIGEQGKYRFFVDYDELRSNYSDTFQTPYVGVGTNLLTLPSNWIKPIVPQVSTTSGNFRALSPTTGLAPSIVSGVVTPPTPAQQAIVNQIIANDVPDFNNVNLETTRKVYSGGVSYNFGPQWEFKASASQTQQDGLKALNMISLTSGTFSATFPNLIDQTTNQYNASLTYTGERFFFTAAYYGSYFINHNNSFTFENAFAPGTLATMSEAPSNQFNQFILKGGYNFSPTTKLVVAGSYGRNTQNDPFLNDPTLPVGLPTTSLNGLVITEMFTARLTSKPIKDWDFGLLYTFNNRRNETPVNTYIFYDAGEPKSGASPFNTALGFAPGLLGSNINIYANRPYSAKVNTVDANAQYQLAKGQFVKADYQYQETDRNCPGSWINCSDAPTTRENTILAAWDGTFNDTLSARASYTYAQRRVDYDENAWMALVPMAGVVPGAPTVGATASVLQFLTQTGLGGFGPVAPYVPLQPGNLGIFFPNNSALPQALYGSRNDIHELLGMRRFNLADRDRNKVRVSVDWQAQDAVSVQASVDYLDDNYTNSAFGLQSSKGWSANLEGNYQPTETFSLNLWYSYQDQRLQAAGASYSSGQITNTPNVGGVAGNTVVSGGCFSTVADKNANAKIDPCLNWTSNEKDQVNTLGAGFNWKSLMAGKLDLWGDVVFSWARTTNAMTGGTYANNPFAVTGAPAVNPAIIFIPAADLPTVINNSVQLRLVGQYALDKASALRLGYMYGHLKSTDYAYDGMQYGTITSVMPNNQTAPSYNVSVIGVSYVYKWQ
jgi:MtrB/PioB family decaheme-associated outer membrane protein